MVKLVLEEHETRALQEALSAWSEIVTSEISRIEIMRAARRATMGQPRRTRRRQLELLLKRAESVLGRSGLVAMDDQVIRLASDLEPPVLRTLDAIHLATAISLPNLDGLVTYDQRLARAAAHARVFLLRPGYVD